MLYAMAEAGSCLVMKISSKKARWLLISALIAIMVFYMGVWHWTGQDDLAQILVLATAATACLVIWMFQSLAKRKNASVKAKN